MKIDIHTHTKKCKQGDASTREIEPQRFYNIVSETDVGIIAITNHNVFDLPQFNAMVDIANNDFQIWPGIELDIDNDGDRGHLIVIVSPSEAKKFSSSVLEATKGYTPDNFKISIEDTVKYFDKFNPVYIAHYMQKYPSLTDGALSNLQELVKNPNRILKEATNSISAGIFISHGHSSIYGSDIIDWDMYKEESNRLPELRLPVDSFEKFGLLLEKDPITINTMLDKKTSENLKLSPFEDSTEIVLKVYDDINIFFGSKGTGKTKILEDIARFYQGRGIKAEVFVSGDKTLEDEYDLKCKKEDVNLEKYGVSYCNDEIADIRRSKEVNVTSLNNYISYFTGKHINKRANKVLLKDIKPLNEQGTNRDFEEYNSSFNNISNFIDLLGSDKAINNVTSAQELTDIKDKLSLVKEKLDKKREELFLELCAIKLLNKAIAKIKYEVSRKTGNPSKPSKTGFSDYARNRIKIEKNTVKIIDCIETQLPSHSAEIGSLGSNKGRLSCLTELYFQNGNIVNSKIHSVSNTKKLKQREFSSAIYEIKEKVYSSDLFQTISKLSTDPELEEIKTIYELLLIKRMFILGSNEYEPSKGESSMLLLHRELNQEKDVYLLDEPEKSLGNDYINDVIVPLIKDKARSGKKVFISTHDANIAVRTLPYNSIYRTHDSDGYKTYIGNPFSNDLVCVDDSLKKLDWKKTSMKTLEGGEEAFNERGKIYGNN